MKPTSIRVGIDFSRSSMLALDHARHLATRLKAPIELVHAFSFEPPRFGPALEDGAGEPSAEWAATGQAVRTTNVERLKELAKKLREAGLEVSISCQDGDPVDVIIGASEERIDSPRSLLVLGHRGTSTIERLLVGNVAESIAASCLTPTLFAKGPISKDGFDHVVAATKLGYRGPSHLDWALTLASSTATIELVHSQQVPDTSMLSEFTSEGFQSVYDDAASEAAARLAALASSATVSSSQTVKPRCMALTPRQTLLTSCAADRAVDLLVVGRRSQPRRRGSLAVWALRHLTCSVLVVPDRNTQQTDLDTAGVDLAFA